MGTLEGRRALITGGASGIGLATSRRLHLEGARVAIVDLNEEGGKAAAREFAGTFIRADVSDSAEMAAAFKQAADALGGLDIAYLNAGVTTRERDITLVSDEQYRRVVGINLDGVFFGAREAARVMEKGGAIIATASIAGLTAYVPDPVYALSKHGVVGLVRGLAAQLAERDITINAICPGIVDTPLIGEGRQMIVEAGFPLIAPEEVAEAVVRAITDGSTGQAWVVQPGREPVRFEFRGIPGPRVPGKEGMVPPGIAETP